MCLNEECNEECTFSSSSWWLNASAGTSHCCQGNCLNFNLKIDFHMRQIYYAVELAEFSIFKILTRVILSIKSHSS